jgi:hypothetical protein
MRWFVPAAIAAALLTACSSAGSGGPGVASIGTSGSPSGSASDDQHADPLAYSKCMRSHGVPQFPDPDPNGGLELSAGPGTGINPDSATFKAAQQACQHLLPTPPPEQQQQNYEALLKFAKCMRDHGISDFPDPSPDGGLQIKSGHGSDLDPNSPTFKAAQQACQKYLPNGGPGKAGTQTGSS